MKSTAVVVLSAIAAAILLGGCLGYEKKVYRFTLNPDGSGTGVIRYVNIVSIDENSGGEEGKDVSFKDFATLVSDYMDGTKFEDDHPGFRVIEKKLLEENGLLCAELKVTFASLDSIGFIRRTNCDCCPILYFSKSAEGDEKLVATNGRLVEDVAASPFVEWEGNTREFTFETTALSDLSGTRSMVEYYRTWKKQK